MAPLTWIERLETLEGSTPAQARLADHLRHAYADVPFLSAAEIARRAGVAPATVSRVVRRLGYEDYAAFKLDVQNELYTLTASPAERYAARTGLPELGPLLASYTRQTTRNVEATLDELRLADLEALCAELVGAQRVFVFGQRVAFGPGWNLALTLGQLLPDVRAVEGARASLADELSALRTGDHVLLLALTRIGNDVRNAVAYLRRRGVPYSVVTNVAAADAPSVFPDARRTLFVRTRGVTAFSDMVPLLALAQLLTIAVERVAPTARTRLTDGEVAYTAFATFVAAEGGGRLERT